MQVHEDVQFSENISLNAHLKFTVYGRKHGPSYIYTHICAMQSHNAMQARNAMQAHLNKVSFCSPGLCDESSVDLSSSSFPTVPPSPRSSYSPTQGHAVPAEVGTKRHVCQK